MPTPIWANIVLGILFLCMVFSAGWAFFFTKNAKKRATLLGIFLIFVISFCTSMYAIAKAYPVPPETLRVCGTMQVNEGTLVILQSDRDQNLWGLVYKAPPTFEAGAKFTSEEFSAMYADKELAKKGLLSSR